MPQFSTGILRISAILAALGAAWPARALGDAEITDLFGRHLNDREVRIVDWEGYIANPAIELFVAPPADGTLPMQVEITADEARLYFNCHKGVQNNCVGATVGPNGPTTTLWFTTDEPRSFFVSIFPDRDSEDDLANLTVEADDGSETSQVTIPVRVTDQDRPNRELDFRIRIDRSRDTTRGGHGYGFFNPRDRRMVAQQAADDWAYFITDMGLDQVPRGEEQTFTWSHPRGFHSGTGTRYSNTNAFTGFLLYVYGIQCDAEGHTCSDADRRSGGAPMAQESEQVQRSDGEVLEPRLWRSGFVDIEIDGNFDQNGWTVVADNPPWYDLDNDAVNDLYSILRHELGHALAFNEQYEAFDRNGTLRIRSYPGLGTRDVPVDASDHFAGTIDPVSLHGAFGNEYHGQVPPRRWLITKLDLLALQAVGYQLRDTTPMARLRLAARSLPRAEEGDVYFAELRAEGGVPVYDWRVRGLPRGLRVDRFTGWITGTPRERGEFPLDVLVCDYVPQTPCAQRTVTLSVVPVGTDCAAQCAADRDRCLENGGLPQVCVTIYRLCLEEVCGLP